MNSSFEKYIKAAMDSHKYDVVCEMANVIYPEKNKINIMQYPGNDVRVYKNREDEVQVLCPRNISYVQESNLTKAISTGTIFDEADEVDKYAGFIVKTKMPIDAMTNKGLENPYKMQEITGATMGVMGEDGDVEISDVDVQNGRNVIDDLLDKDSKEFKDVKNVVDDYLDNDDHEYGYDRDFTVDIQQLRDEIQQFKDSDISPEDSITDMDWDDNWGSATSIMGDHNDAEDEKDDNDDDHDIDVSDDDDEDDISFEEYSVMMESGDMFIQEGAIYTLKKIGYNPLTKTFITDIPIDEGSGAKMPCKIKFKLTGDACFRPSTNTIEIPIKELLGNSDLVISTIKHEEGHFYISLDRGHFNQDFERAEKLVNKHGSKLADHEKTREEYVADKYAAETAGVEATVKMLKQLGFETRRKTAKCKQKCSIRNLQKYFNRYKRAAQKYMNGKDTTNLDSWQQQTLEMLKRFEQYHDAIEQGGFEFINAYSNMIEKLSYEMAHKHNGVYLHTAPGTYSKMHNAKDDVFRKGMVPDASEKPENAIARMKQTVSIINKEYDEVKRNEMDAIRQKAREYKNDTMEYIKDLKSDPFYQKHPDRLKEKLEREKKDTKEILGRMKDDYERLKKTMIPLTQKIDKLMRFAVGWHKEIIARMDESQEIFDNGVRARIAYVRKYANKPQTESATYRLRDPFFTESYNDTLIDYKITEESGAGCMSCNPSGGGNVNKTIEESDSPVETPSVPPPPTNTTAGEPTNPRYKVKPEDPDDLNSSPDTSNNHAPVMSAVKMESFHQEFSIKRPKHLKAIDVRSIVAYVTVEMNAIKDSNDQAMIAGYVCSKLELIDFYITVLDTHDDRYVVPHSRQYLADGQRQLSDLLTKILKIRPIDKSERIWKAIVS